MSEEAKSVFLKAIELSETERDRFLGERASQNPALCQRVQSLLNAYKSAGNFLSQIKPSWGALDQSTLTDSELTQRNLEANTVLAERYRIQEQIGVGGMGLVYRAQQFFPVERDVAIKLLRTSRDVARVAWETQALASLEHPYIAKFFDAGNTPDGDPFFVMEYVRGVKLTSFCQDKQLTLEQRIHLFIEVLSAVEYAHSKGVIHRDLKPSNILIVDESKKLIPKLIDFGLAKLSEPVRILDSIFDGQNTNMGFAGGTPLYMAPEQADYLIDHVDVRSDVYSLGVILYELLTSKTPQSPEKLSGKTLGDVFQILKDSPVIAPSMRNRGVDAGTSFSRIPRELDWITIKALAVDAKHRYSHVAQFREDLQKFLEARPVSVGPSTVGYRMSKWMRRNRLLSASVLIAATGLGVGATIAARNYFEAIVARNQAEQNWILAERRESIANEINRFMQEDILNQAGLIVDGGKIPGKISEITIAQALDRASQKAAERFRSEPQIEGAMRQVLGTSFYNLGDTTKSKAEYERAVHLLSKSLGPDAKETLAAKRGLAALEVELSIQPNSSELTKDLAEKDTGDKLQNLLLKRTHANALRQDGKFREAEAIYRSLADEAEAIYGPNDRHTLLFNGDVGGVFLVERNYAEAKRIYESVLKTQKAVLGKDADVWGTMNNLAVVYGALGDFIKQRDMLEQALAMASEQLPADHPQLNIMRAGLTAHLMQTGKSKEAIPILEKVLEQFSRSLGDRHQMTLTEKANLARAYSLTNQSDKAESLFDEVMEQGKDVFPLGSPSYLTLCVNRTNHFERTGQFGKAVESQKQVVEIHRQKYGAESLESGSVLAVLGHYLLENKQPNEAEAPLRAALAIRNNLIPDDFRRYMNESMLGQALLEMEKFDEAGPLIISGCDGVLDRLEKVAAPARRDFANRVIARRIAWEKHSGSQANVEAWEKRREEIVKSL